MEYVINYKSQLAGSYNTATRILIDNEDGRYDASSLDEALTILYEIYSDDEFTGAFKQMQWMASLSIRISSPEV